MTRRDRLGLLGALLFVGACSRGALNLPELAPVDAGVDAAVEPPPLCLQVPPEGGPLRAALTLPVKLSAIDLFFLIDASGSMSDEIGNVRDRLRDFVVPQVRSNIAGAAFGLAFVGEFPVSPHGNLGEPRPYELRVAMTTDARQIESALTLVPDWSNADFPEAQVEGLYQAATGEGLESFISPSFGCASGGSGGACFRDDALPVIMLITDAPFHNGPPGIDPVAPYRFTPAPHSYQQTVSALRARGIVVLGLGASDSLGPSPLPHLTAIARDSGAVNADGIPMAFSIGEGGNRVGNTIITAIEELAEGLPLDVDAFASDVAGDDIDARSLITRIRPLSANPIDGVEAITDRAFIGTRPGTNVTFEIEVDVSSLPPSTTTRRIPALITFRAAGRSTIGQQEVEILIPGTDNQSCDAG